MEKYSKIKDRGLCKEIEEYSFEIQEAIGHRRRKRQGRIIIIGAVVLLAALTFNEIFKPSISIPPLFQSGKIVVMDELTAHPATVLIDAARDVMEKAKPGQEYIVKVTVEPL